MEKRAPFFLTNLLRRSPKNSESSEEKGWGNTPHDTTFNGWGSSPGSTSSGPITDGWADEPLENHFNGWGSDPGSLHRSSPERTSNGWAYVKSKDECNGWGSDPGSLHRSSLEKTSNGWAYVKSKDECNGWGSGLGLGSGSSDKCTALETNSIRWMSDEPLNDKYNGWNSSGKCTSSKETSDGWMDDHGLDHKLPASEPIHKESRLVNFESWAPSAPPLPDEDFNEDPAANNMVKRDLVAKIEGKIGDALCVVCWEAPVEGACVPCGHMATCMTCLHEIESKQGTCPVCRAKIDKAMRIYAISTE